MGDQTLEDIKASHYPAEGNKKPLSSESQLICPRTSADFPEARSVRPAPLDFIQVPIPTRDKNQVLDVGSFPLTA